MRQVELTKRYAKLAEAVERRLGDRVTRLASSTGELGYQVAPDDLLECCRVLRDDDASKLEMLMDLSGIDYQTYGRDEWQTEGATGTGFSRGRSTHPETAEEQHDVAAAELVPPSRFAVAYHLMSITLNHRLRLKVFCADDAAPLLDSVTPIWASADWYEREAFDLFGILFRGHPDLRRILTDYGFIGHPFRKDFPLIGNVEMRYDPAKGRVVYEPVTIEPRTLVPKVIRDDNRYSEDLKGSGDA
jgi:NADH-quinone oxidoreductase subunit C